MWLCWVCKRMCPTVARHEEGSVELFPMIDSGNWESLPLVMYPIVIPPGSSRQSQYNSHKMAKLNGSQNQPRSHEYGKGTELGVVWVSQGIILKYCQPRVKHKFMALSVCTDFLNSVGHALKGRLICSQFSVLTFGHMGAPKHQPGAVKRFPPVCVNWWGKASCGLQAAEAWAG